MPIVQCQQRFTKVIYATPDLLRNHQNNCSLTGLGLKTPAKHQKMQSAFQSKTASHLGCSRTVGPSNWLSSGPGERLHTRYSRYFRFGNLECQSKFCASDSGRATQVLIVNGSGQRTRVKSAFEV